MGYSIIQRKICVEAIDLTLGLRLLSEGVGVSVCSLGAKIDSKQGLQCM